MRITVISDIKVYESLVEAGLEDHKRTKITISYS